MNEFFLGDRIKVSYKNSAIRQFMFPMDSKTAEATLVKFSDKLLINPSGDPATEFGREKFLVFF